MIQFLENPRFNTEIRYGTVGGPEFNTDVTVVTSGDEFRNGNWLDSRGRWEIGQDLLDKKQLDELTAFFRMVRGKLIGFRFKDWGDFQVLYPTLEKPELPMQGGFMQIAPGILQMVKVYQVGIYYTYRIISKPVEGTVLLHGVGGTVDYTKGQVAGTGGFDPLTFDGTTFDFAMAWEGEFDVPARFDSDRFESTFEAYRETDGERLFGLTSLPIVELRPDMGTPTATTTPVTP